MDSRAVRKKRKVSSLTKNQRLLKPYLEGATPLCSDVIGIVSDYATPIVVVESYVTTIDLYWERLHWINKTHLATRKQIDNKIMFRDLASGKRCDGDGIPNDEEQKFYLGARLGGRSCLWQNGECFSYDWPWMHGHQEKTLSIHCDVGLASPYRHQPFTCFADFNVLIGHNLDEERMVDIWRIEIV